MECDDLKPSGLEMEKRRDLETFKSLWICWAQSYSSDWDIFNKHQSKSFKIKYFLLENFQYNSPFLALGIFRNTGPNCTAVCTWHNHLLLCKLSTNTFSDWVIIVHHFVVIVKYKATVNKCFVLQGERSWRDNFLASIRLTGYKEQKKMERWRTSIKLWKLHIMEVEK